MNLIFLPRENNGPDLLEHPLVQQIASSHEKSSAQILLRHLVQQGIIVIPKSTNSERIKENGQVPIFMCYLAHWPLNFLYFHFGKLLNYFPWLLHKI
jgi:diketogulonate reductase-like aldo/keto reductase